jgi:hypothetical protein
MEHRLSGRPWWRFGAMDVFAHEAEFGLAFRTGWGNPMRYGSCRLLAAREQHAQAC